ncbi:hypothetical protein BIFDEN_00965 [Bifidobacterium dentium ATCC 27678]|nr:hypothetical protein BIFDEN_00965 [Bifidobacterium dentium ATCC 27678]
MFRASRHRLSPPAETPVRIRKRSLFYANRFSMQHLLFGRVAIIVIPIPLPLHFRCAKYVRDRTSKRFSETCAIMGVEPMRCADGNHDGADTTSTKGRQ